MKHVKIFETDSGYNFESRVRKMMGDRVSSGVKSRSLNKMELKKLVMYLAERQFGGSCSDEELEDLVYDVYSANSVIIEDYISDGPGYYGNILFVVWGGGPEYFEVFTFNKNGDLEKITNPEL